MEGREILLAMAIVSAASAGAAHAQISEEMKGGMLLPLTGKLSALGEHLQPTAIMAGDDFNDYLKAGGHPWRVSLVV